jgi:hypothetical protein
VVPAGEKCEGNKKAQDQTQRHFDIIMVAMRYWALPFSISCCCSHGPNQELKKHAGAYMYVKQGTGLLTGTAQSALEYPRPVKLATWKEIG